MTLKITNIRERGNLEKERVVMRVQSDVDVGSYIMLNCVISGEDSVESGDIPLCYWFDDKKVKKDDLIVLYTKKGVSSQKINDNGQMSYFFYWDRPDSIWSDNRRAVLVKTETYQFSP